MVKEMGFSAEYIDQISPADRALYINYYREDEHNKRKSQGGNMGGPTIGSPIDPIGAENK
jgi:hypothetical protein